MNISVFGLGKLGLCTAACFAAKGHAVIGVDTDTALVDALLKKECPIDEPGLEKLLFHPPVPLTVTQDAARAICDTEVSLIIVPTPSLPDGSFTNEYIIAALRTIGPLLADKKTYHCIVVVSTVMPGSCDAAFVPLLEELSGKTCPKGFGLVYNPEFIAIGSVIHDFLNPDMVLIGESDLNAGRIMEQVYKSVCESDPYVARMSLVNAEITKLSLNCYVTLKVSFVNELSALCEKVPGADIDSITGALGADTRIGGKYLRGGLGFGGPCFPRDNVAFQRFAENAGYTPRLSPQVVAINAGVVARIVELIDESVTPGQGTLAVFGLSYKAGTHIIEQSQSMLLIEELLRRGYRVAIHDPKALDAARVVLGDAVCYCPSPYQLPDDVCGLVLMTPWPEYALVKWDEIVSILRQSRPVLIDTWRIVPEQARERFDYHALGMGTNRIKNSSAGKPYHA